MEDIMKAALGVLAGLVAWLIRIIIGNQKQIDVLKAQSENRDREIKEIKEDLREIKRDIRALLTK